MFSSSALTKWVRSTAALRRLEDGVLPLTVVATDLETRGGGADGEAGPPSLPWWLRRDAGHFPPGAHRAALVGRRQRGIGHPDRPGRQGRRRPGVGVAERAVRTHARPRTAIDVLLRSVSITLARYTASTATTWANKCELYLVPAPLVPGVSPFNFDKSSQLIDAATV